MSPLRRLKIKQVHNTPKTPSQGKAQQLGQHILLHINSTHTLVMQPFLRTFLPLPSSRLFTSKFTVIHFLVSGHRFPPITPWLRLRFSTSLMVQ